MLHSNAAPCLRACSRRPPARSGGRAGRFGGKGVLHAVGFSGCVAFGALVLVVLAACDRSPGVPGQENWPDILYESGSQSFLYPEVIEGLEGAYVIVVVVPDPDTAVPDVPFWGEAAWVWNSSFIRSGRSGVQWVSSYFSKPTTYTKPGGRLSTSPVTIEGYLTDSAYIAVYQLEDPNGRFEIKGGTVLEDSRTSIGDVRPPSRLTEYSLSFTEKDLGGRAAESFKRPDIQDAIHRIVAHLQGQLESVPGRIRGTTRIGSRPYTQVKPASEK